MILIYLESDLSSYSASSRSFSRISQSMVMLIFSFNGFILFTTDLLYAKIGTALDK